MTDVSECGKVITLPWLVLRSCSDIPLASYYCSYAANYLHNWKCIAVLKGDGSGVNTEEIADKEKSGSLAVTRYYKLGTISNPNQVPWH